MVAPWLGARLVSPSTMWMRSMGKSSSSATTWVRRGAQAGAQVHMPMQGGDAAVVPQR